MYRSKQMHLLASMAIVAWRALAVPSYSLLVDFSVPVNLHYDGTELSAVLDDIHRKYNVSFSYSRQIIPVRQRMYIHADGMAFGDAIEMLFAQTQVVYGVIGDQIVLSIDVNKIPVPPDLSSLHDGMDDSLASSGRPAFEKRI